MSRSIITTEQKAVVASKARLLAVDAFAGTGKTTTLVEYASARPASRILYIAFNKSVATEAKERFPSNVECRTTHSLAYGVMGRKFADKLGNAQPFEVAQIIKGTPRRARQVLDALSAWLCSADGDISVDHVDRETVETEADAQVLVDLAKTVWQEMQNQRSPLRMPHDGYLKLYAMSKPRLPYDIILLDEAQDTNPLTLGMVMAQKHATIVLVGDKHQGIYGFRKAMNAMEHVEAEERIALTKSFRFGQRIADIATLILQGFKEETHRIEGRPDIEVKWFVDTKKHYSVIGRTNAALFAAGANVVRHSRSRSKIHFVGGFDSYLFGKVLDAYHLWADERSKIKDQSISRFTSFSKFKEYGTEVRDAEVKALVKTVEEYRTEIPTIYSAMKEAETPLEDRADVTLTTAHRAKGLEWDQVLLTDDYIELPPEDDEFDPEEVNLLYVALTRAIRAVAMPASLCAWVRERDPSLMGSGPASRPDAGISVDPDDLPAEQSDDELEQQLRQAVHGYEPALRQSFEFLFQRLDEARSR